MIGTSHVVIGGAAGIAVGTVTQNPLLGLVAGVVSHLLSDALPHLDGPLRPKLSDPNNHDTVIWTPGFYVFAITDSLIAFIATLYIWYTKDNLDFASMYAWGSFGGYLPDLVDNFPLWRYFVREKPGFKQFHAFHKWIHDTWMGRFPMIRYWPLGIVTQLVTVLPCLYYIMK